MIYDHMLTEIFFQTQIPHSFFLAWQRAQLILFTLLSIVYEHLQILKRIPFLFFIFWHRYFQYFFSISTWSSDTPSFKMEYSRNNISLLLYTYFFFIYLFFLLLCNVQQNWTAVTRCHNTHKKLYQMKKDNNF